MLQWLTDKIFRISEEPARQPVTTLAKEMEGKVGAVTRDIFIRHGRHLLQKPLTYIPPAIWGADESGPLSAEQQDIWRETDPVVREIVRSMQGGFPNPEQIFALEYLVRGLIVSRLAHMVQCFLPGTEKPHPPQMMQAVDLANTSTMGSA